jgi:hypothetical protein
MALSVIQTPRVTTYTIASLRSQTLCNRNLADSKARQYKTVSSRKLGSRNAPLFCYK